VHTERLTIKQTPTGYWVVEQGAMQLASAMTRSAAEAERDLLTRLRNRSLRRVAPPRRQAQRVGARRTVGRY
jgi:hypothetical protein